MVHVVGSKSGVKAENSVEPVEKTYAVGGVQLCCTHG